MNPTDINLRREQKFKAMKRDIQKLDVEISMKQAFWK